MKNQTKINHIALQYKDKEKAKIFFQDILELSLIKQFKLTKKLSKQIFGKSEKLEIIVYANDHAKFEVFITEKKQESIYNHICIEIDDKEDFIIPVSYTHLRAHET